MKRIILIILSLACIFFPTDIVNASVGDNADNSIRFINSLDIIDIESDDIEAATVTRAKFVDMVIRAMNYDINETAGTLFTDVTDKTPYFGSIAKAVDMGIVKGNDGLFYPDAPITYNAALKITVAALGYEKAAIVYGGYPIGYSIVANDIDLIKSLPKVGNDPLSFREASILIYNFMNADLCNIVAVLGDDVQQMRCEGENILTNHYGFKRVEGIVKTAGFMSMIPDAQCSESRMYISGKAFKTDVEDAESYLGLNVIGWYDEYDNMKAIYIKSNNSIKAINIQDVDPYKNDFVIKSYDDTTHKETEYRLSKSFSLVENGRFISPSTKAFEFESGTLELIDNDSDGLYDVVISNKAEYMLVSNVDMLNEVVYDSLSSGVKVPFKNKDGYYYELWAVDKNGIYSEMEFSELTSETILTYYASYDKKFLRAYATATSVKGTVTEIYDNTILVDGKEYKTNGYFRKYYSVQVGEVYKFNLSYDGTITTVTKDNKKGMQYGYMMGFGKENSGIAKDVQMKILDTSGKKEVYTLDTNIIFDGIKTSSTDVKLENAFLSGGYPKYQVIRYALNSKGAVSKIDTLCDLAADYTIDDKYGNMSMGDNTLTRYLKGKKTFWHSGNNLFVPHFALGNNTIMFRVPYDILIGNEPKEYEDKYFEFITPQNLPSYNAIYVDAYNIDKYMQAEAVVVYSEEMSGGSITDKTPVSVVEKVTTAITEDGELTKSLVIWKNGTYCKHRIGYETYQQLLNKGQVPASGDVIRFQTNAENEISSLIIDAKYDANLKTAVLTSSALAEAPTGDAEFRGRVYTTNGELIMLFVDQQRGFNTSWSDHMVDNLQPFRVYEHTNIALYDTEKQTVTHGNAGMLVGSVTVGEAEASKVVFKSYASGIDTMIIYK